MSQNWFMEIKLFYNYYIMIYCFKIVFNLIKARVELKVYKCTSTYIIYIII